MNFRRLALAGGVAAVLNAPAAVMAEDNNPSTQDDTVKVCATL